MGLILLTCVFCYKYGMFANIHAKSRASGNKSCNNKSYIPLLIGSGKRNKQYFSRRHIGKSYAFDTDKSRIASKTIIERCYVLLLVMAYGCNFYMTKMLHARNILTKLI